MSKLTRNENGKFEVPIAPTPVIPTREMTDAEIRQQFSVASQQVAQVQQAMMRAQANLDHWLSLVQQLDQPE